MAVKVAGLGGARGYTGKSLSWPPLPATFRCELAITWVAARLTNTKIYICLWVLTDAACSHSLSYFPANLCRLHMVGRPVYCSQLV